MQPRSHVMCIIVLCPLLGCHHASTAVGSRVVGILGPRINELIGEIEWYPCLEDVALGLQSHPIVNPYATGERLQPCT